MTSDELRVLIPQAQAGNPDAIHRLCEGFSRLIFKVSHRDITYRILDFPDLSVDGTFPLGAAVAVCCILNGISPWLSLIVAFFAGALAGLVTGIIHVKFKVRDLLSGIITMTALYSINQHIAGGKANVPLFGQETIFNSGIVIGGDRILDGAFVDNIPVQPLLDKDLDYIFCIYFDNNKYIFESPEFDSKIIKLYDFPNKGRFDLLFYEPGTYDSLYKYAYEYTEKVIDRIFGTEGSVYEAIAEYNQSHEATYKPRLTADVVLNNINIMTNRYFKKSTLNKNSRQLQ